jgi:hypothetical protein
MHWRTPFPPKRPSVLAELIAVVRASLAPEQVIKSDPAASLPDELPAAEPAPEPSQTLTNG